MSDQEQSADVQNSDNQHDQGGQQVADEVIDNEADGQSDGDSQEQPHEEETDEIEVDGAKFALPKSAAEKLKAERMMQADYTRKTQAHAETVKAFEAREQQHQQRVTDYEQEFTDRAKLHQIGETLKQYGQVDWQSAWEQDHIAAGKAQAHIQALQNERVSLEHSISQKQQQRALDQQQEIAKLVQEAEAYVAREIPGWNQERTGQVMQFAASEGLQLNPELTNVLFKHPALFKVMHKAAMFDQLAKSQAKQQQKSAPPPKPASRVGASSPVQKEPSKMTDREFAEWRRSQIKNRT